VSAGGVRVIGPGEWPVPGSALESVRRILQTRQHIYNHEAGQEQLLDVLNAPDEDRAGRADNLGSISEASMCPIRSGERIRDHGLRVSRKSSRSISPAEKEEATMSQTMFPPGWDEDKVRRVLNHYENQTEDDAVLKDEAGVKPSETVMNVPHDLVGKVRELIAKRQS